MPQGAYQSVIEGAAARLKETDRPLEIEPALTQKLLEDIEKGGNKDALPILAETSEVNKLELLSIYFDYELQQPIFQTSSYLNISSFELSQYFKNSKGRDTLSEINKLNFIPNKLNDILLHVSTMEKKGKWSSHAIINIISFIERYYGNEIKLKTTLDKYFPNISNFYLGKQKYIERVRSI